MTNVVSDNNEDKAAELTLEITTIVQDEIGFNKHFASQIAEALVRGIRKRLGGQSFYIPAPDKSARDKKIKEEFNGTNIDEVCEKYNVSKTSVYRIVGG